jgi:outer membrane protein OmpA-like peptidoglycan-associated protein
MGVIWAAGCATTAPKELTEARNEYQRASQGPARTLAPVQLHEAEKALAVANDQFHQRPRSQDVADLAYVATRAAQVAEVQANAELARRQQQQALDSLKAYEDNQQTVALRQELSQAREDMSAQQAALANLQENLAQKLSSANVHQEARGLVIALPSSLLFAFGHSDLLPNAREKLADLAEALKQLPGQKIRVAGYTDAVGSSEYNAQLSHRRAEAVRDYLSSRGIPREQIEALGYGKDRPVADNATPEGRADNRRVEIVLPSSPIQNETRGIGGSG